MRGRERGSERKREGGGWSEKEMRGRKEELETD